MPDEPRNAPGPAGPSQARSRRAAARQVPLARRHALRLGAAAAAVAAGSSLVAGCAQSASSASTDAGQGGGSTSAGGAQTTTRSAVQHFRSRPDLQPATAVIDVHDGPTAPGVILLDSHSGVGQQGPMILDKAGRLVWFKPLSAHASPDLRAMNLRVQSYRGEPVLSWWQGAVVHAHGEGHYVLASSAYQEIRTVHAHNGLMGDLHEFLITDAGTALFTCYGTAYADLRSLRGSARNMYYYGVIQEVDLATGKLVFEWRSDRHVPFSDSYAPMMTSKTVGWDPYHINSINIAPDGNLIVSFRNTWTIYKVHRTSGKVLWRMGGKHSDFTMGANSKYAWQHHVTPHASGIYTIFDNEAGDYKVGKHSRGLVIKADETSRHVSFVRQYNPPTHILSPALGSVQELPGGHVFMGWGEKPYFTEFTTDGKLLFSGHLAGRGTFDYRAFKSAWTGRPGGRPAIAASRSGGGMTVWASWNGDTEVAHWKVLAGRKAGNLSVVATAARRGFETAIHVGHAAKYAAVAGYDASGHELGRSAARQL